MPRNTAASLSIRELSPGDMPAMYSLIKQANPKITRTRFESLLSDMRKAGYRCAGAYKGKTLVGVAGFWVGYRFWCGKYIDVDNVVVAKSYQGSGIGTKLMAWVEKEGKRLKCDISVLDSYTIAHPAHRFYFRQGYVILGYHFTKEL
jgi:GNAT superfamily N-acetyltransferase